MTAYFRYQRKPLAMLDRFNRETDIEIDLLNLMPDDTPERRSELEEGVETGPKHSHTYYRDLKKKERTGGE